MMYAKDFRDSACQHLGGKWTCGYWSKFAVIMLVYFLINIVVSALSYIYIGWVVDLVISGPIALGIAEISLRVVRAFDELLYYPRQSANVRKLRAPCVYGDDEGQ